MDLKKNEISLLTDSKMELSGIEKKIYFNHEFLKTLITSLRGSQSLLRFIFSIGKVLLHFNTGTINGPGTEIE